MTIHTNIPAIPITLLIWHFEMSLGYCMFMLIIIQLCDKTFSYTFAITEVHIIWNYAKNKHSWKLGRKPPTLSAFLSETWLITPMWNTHVPILQIHTQIPPIQISSLGYQLYQLFKYSHIEKYRTQGSWCRWKPCRQPYHNTY